MCGKTWKQVCINITLTVVFAKTEGLIRRVLFAKENTEKAEINDS